MGGRPADRGSARSATLTSQPGPQPLQRLARTLTYGPGCPSWALLTSRSGHARGRAPCSNRPPPADRRSRRRLAGRPAPLQWQVSRSIRAGEHTGREPAGSETPARVAWRPARVVWVARAGRHLLSPLAHNLRRHLPAPCGCSCRPGSAGAAPHIPPTPKKRLQARPAATKRANTPVQLIPEAHSWRLWLGAPRRPGRRRRPQQRRSSPGSSWPSQPACCRLRPSPPPARRQRQRRLRHPGGLPGQERMMAWAAPAG